MPPTPGQPLQPTDPDALVAILRDDARFEPPASAMVAARALGARISARAAAPRTSVLAHLAARAAAEVGDAFDRAGAAIVAWINPEPDLGEARLAFAGLRDDIASGLTADTLEATLAASGLVVHAERTRAQDGVVRLVGEVHAIDRSPARATIVVLDQQARILAFEESDEIGLFHVRLPEGSTEIAFVPHPSAAGGAGSTESLRASVLPLGDRRDERGAR